MSGANNASGAGARSTLVHDLRGPLITIDGFAGEIDRALEELETLLEGGADASVVTERLAALLADDLRPCLGFVESATRTMHERIDFLAATLAESSDG